jgi:hypothetical protein
LKPDSSYFCVRKATQNIPRQAAKIGSSKIFFQKQLKVDSSLALALMAKRNMDVKKVETAYIPYGAN